MLISTGEISVDQTKLIENTTKELKKVKGKSHSQRLREVLYRLHEQDNTMLSFAEYYSSKMENLIEMVKERLEDEATH